MLQWLRKRFFPKLEDGEIISKEDGFYQRCPKCKSLVPKIVNTPYGKNQELFDMKGCIQGFTDLKTGKQYLLITCKVCS